MIWLVIGVLLMVGITILSLEGILLRLWREEGGIFRKFIKKTWKTITISFIIFFLPLFILDYLYGTWIPTPLLIGVIPGMLFWIPLTLLALLPFLGLYKSPSVREKYNPRSVRLGAYALAGTVLLIYLISIFWFPGFFEYGNSLDFVLLYSFLLYLIFLYIFLYPRITSVPIEKLEKAMPTRKDYKILGALFALSIVLMILFGSTVSFFPEVYHNEIEDNMSASTYYPHTVSPDEIRLVPWSVARAYLERVYGDAAAYLDTSGETLTKNTHPTMVDGKFLWLNVPEFEPWKWLGGRKLPFYVMVNATGNNIEAKRVDMEMKVSTSNIDWNWRVCKIVRNVAGENYHITQVRFDLDDNYHPYYIAYLTYLHPPFYYETLEKLVVIDAVSGNAKVYGTKNAPSWLEVVYPDEYVYHWVKWWAQNRFGWYYATFVKSRLYDPDLPDAKFLLIHGTTYWYIPLRQMQSHVLGGYVLMNTRTGKPEFYDRAERNYVDYSTAWAQLYTYLSSGELGYMQLSIREGYLYAVDAGNGTVKEVYILPLYAGLTLQKIAIIDPVNYQSKPIIADDIDSALEILKRGGSGSERRTLIVQVDGMYISSTTAYIYTNGTIITVDKENLKYGNNSADEDWVILQIAYSRYLHGENVTLILYMVGDNAVDVSMQ